MSLDLQKPPVVDLDVLLTPISEEAPSGESMRYSGIYDEIKEARRADDNLNQGEWKTDLKVADFRKVVGLAVPALSEKTKDIQIGVWLTEALIRQHGFVGLRDGLKLLTGLQENFWETLHPEVEDGDQEARANAITWLDTQGSQAVKFAPFTGVEGYGFLDWEDSKTFDFPDNIESLGSDEAARLTALKTQAEREQRVTADKWRKEWAKTKRATAEEVNFTLDECWLAFSELNRVIEEKYERNQMPGLSGFKKALDDIHTQVKKLVEEKRAEEPDDVLLDESGEVVGGAEGVAGGAGVATGAINSRRDALKRLDDVAMFFQRTEPHSPVSYLVQRAVRWGNMPLENWLEEVIKDPSVLYQLRETLGFGADNSGAAGQ